MDTVLPRISAPARAQRRDRRRLGPASSSGGRRLPARVGKPATWKMSLTPTGTPKSGGRALGSRPARVRAPPASRRRRSQRPALGQEGVDLGLAPREARLAAGRGEAGALARAERAAVTQARRDPSAGPPRLSRAAAPLAPPAAPRRRCAGSRCSGRGCRRAPGGSRLRSGSGFSSRNGTSVIRKPGVQKPHCSAVASQNASCSGWSSPRLAAPGPRRSSPRGRRPAPRASGTSAPARRRAARCRRRRRRARSRRGCR